jgi:type IV fimbrial biogenesis protein FimT
MLKRGLAPSQRGFTFIELMVTLTISGVLLATALPSITNMVAMARMRAVAETMQSAIRLAQAEAIRRSRSTAFAITSAEPVLNALPAQNGQRWWVQSLMRSGETTATQILLRNGSEALSANVGVTGPALMCFNSFGQQITLKGSANGLNILCSAPLTATLLTEYTFSHPQTTRRLRIQVSLGGEVRMCDPDKVLATDTPDGCRVSA